MQASKYELVPLEAAEVASCGSKAAACGRLLQTAQASCGLFKAPQGTVVPFGIMNLALKVRLMVRDEICRCHLEPCLLQQEHGPGQWGAVSSGIMKPALKASLNCCQDQNDMHSCCHSCHACCAPAELQPRPVGSICFPGNCSPLQQHQAHSQGRLLAPDTGYIDEEGLSFRQLYFHASCQSQPMTKYGSQAAKQTSGFQELLKQAEEASPEAVGQVAQQLQDLILATPIKEAFLQSAGSLAIHGSASSALKKPYSIVMNK